MRKRKLGLRKIPMLGDIVPKLAMRVVSLSLGCALVVGLAWLFATGSGCAEFSGEDSPQGSVDSGGVDGGALDGSPSPPIGEDGGVSSSDGGDASTCTRAEFAEGFNGIQSAWSQTPKDEEGIERTLDNGQAAEGISSLLFEVASTDKSSRGSFFQQSVEQTPCPLTATFKLRLNQSPVTPNYIHVMSFEMVSSTQNVPSAILVSIMDDKLLLAEQAGEGETHVQLTQVGLNKNAWVTLSLSFDKTAKGSEILLSVDGDSKAFPASLTHVAPKAVRLGIAYASLGATARFWLDDFSIK